MTESYRTFKMVLINSLPKGRLKWAIGQNSFKFFSLIFIDNLKTIGLLFLIFFFVNWTLFPIPVLQKNLGPGARLFCPYTSAGPPSSFSLITQPVAPWHNPSFWLPIFSLVKTILAKKTPNLFYSFF